MTCQAGILLWHHPCNRPHSAILTVTLRSTLLNHVLQTESSGHLLWSCLGATVPALLLSLPLSIMLTIHCLGKSSMSGHAPYFFAPLVSCMYCGTIRKSSSTLWCVAMAALTFRARQPLASCSCHGKRSLASRITAAVNQGRASGP